MNKNIMWTAWFGIACLTWVLLSMVSCEKSSYRNAEDRGYQKHVNKRVWDAPESKVEDE